ncbi:MAG TPA: hypothetical protein VF754_09625 [Pyrinomonadaceae bacterium]
MKIAKSTALDMSHRNERGAALISALLISLMLLLAGGALILTTAMSASNAVDATAEAQAYYAAEAGVQAALNVLRGNDAPSPALPAGQKISFRRAVTLTDSNATANGDTSTFPRLSRWLTYENNTPGSRVSLGNGVFYSVAVSDPDNTDASLAPTRLLITATGYGPKGAVKQVEALITAGAFDFDPPGAITGIPDDKGQEMQFTVDDGHSGGGGEHPRRPKFYSGVDAANALNIKPAFAVGSSDLSMVRGELDTAMTYGGNQNTLQPNSITNPGAQALTAATTPSQLSSPAAASDFVSELREIALAQGRVFEKGELPSTVDLGSPANPLITFIDGDVVIDHQTSGAGLMVVQGEFRPRIGFDYKGLILVIGENAKVRFDDHGENSQPTHSVSGAIVVASVKGNSFERAEFRDEDPDTQTTIQFDSGWVKRALGLTGFRTLGARER